MYINKKLIIVFSILFIIILFYKNKENLTFDEIVKKREKENREKKKFDIIVNIPDLHKNYIHIKGFGSQTLTNIYKVDYNNDINQRK